MSRNQRLSFLGIAAVIAVVRDRDPRRGLRDDGDSGDQRVGDADGHADGDARRRAGQETATTPTATPTPKPEPPLLQAGKVTKLRFTEGDTVRFRVRSDGPEEVHVHGYDMMKDIGPARPITVSFKATITGIFEVEFEDSGEQIAELRVDPR